MKMDHFICSGNYFAPHIGQRWTVLLDTAYKSMVHLQDRVNIRNALFYPINDALLENYIRHGLFVDFFLV